MSLGLARDPVATSLAKHSPALVEYTRADDNDSITMMGNSNRGHTEGPHPQSS